MALTTENSFRVERDTDEAREVERRASLEAAYRREHAAYAQQGKSDRAAAVGAAARAELGVDITPAPAPESSGGEVRAELPRRRPARTA